MKILIDKPWLLAVLGLSISTCPEVINGFSHGSIDRIYQSPKSFHGTKVFSTVTEQDCGCGPTVFAGKPPTAAQNTIDHREVISKLPLFKIDGSKTSIDEILGSTNYDTSLVVFMRSLGWPFCQEQIVQYNRIRQSDLLAKGVNLVVVSIGLPEKGKMLAKHLEVDNGEDWIFVDPENVLYDALQLNSGVETTFLSVETPFAFRDRFFGTNGRKDGMKDLLGVLRKWKDAIFIPPKQEQAFQQGGAFVFKGKDTAYAYYDAAAGTHLEVAKAVEEATKVASST